MHQPLTFLIFLNFFFTVYTFKTVFICYIYLRWRILSSLTSVCAVLSCIVFFIYYFNVNLFEWCFIEQQLINGWMDGWIDWFDRVLRCIGNISVMKRRQDKRTSSHLLTVTSRSRFIMLKISQQHLYKIIRRIL